MVTLEQVEKLREYANISYDEAKAALENASGDILQALIDLEREGKVKPPQSGGHYTSGSMEVSSNAQKDEYSKENKQTKNQCGEKSAFRRHMGEFFRWVGELIHKGNVNAYVVEKNGVSIMKLPITVLVLLLVFAFWVIVPLMIVGMFFSFRYYFQGPDIKSNKVNDAMDTVANAAEEIKKDLRN